MFHDYDRINKIMQSNLGAMSPDYEEGKSPLEMMEHQTAFLEKTSHELRNLADSAKSQADSAKSQADSAKSIAENSRIHAEIAVKQSQKSDLKSWLSIAIAAFGTFMEFSIHHAEILEFIKSLLAK